MLLSLVTRGFWGASCGIAMTRHWFLSFFQKHKLVISFTAPCTFKSWERQTGVFALHAQETPLNLVSSRVSGTQQMLILVKHLWLRLC